LKQLNGIEYFAAGGPNISDAVAQTIAQATKLNALTMAYPDVTAEVWKQFTNLSNVHTLYLPGAAIDDEVVSHWPPLHFVQNLDLSQTGISAVGLKHLIGNRVSLARLRLDDTQVTRADLSMLDPQFDLIELSLAGIGADAETIKKILSNGVIQQLDLSDAPLDPETLTTILEQGKSLQHLILRNVNLDSLLLAQIANRYPDLKFDVEGSNATSNVLAYLVDHGQIVESDQWYDYQAMEQYQKQMQQQWMQQGSSQLFSFEPPRPDYPSIINTHAFASPPDLQATFVDPSRDAIESDQNNDTQTDGDIESEE
jgi:hypothetical protein